MASVVLDEAGNVVTENKGRSDLVELPTADSACGRAKLDALVLNEVINTEESE